MPTTRPLRVAVIAALVFTMTACPFGLARRTATPTPSRTIKVSYGKGVDLSAPGVKKRSKSGTLHIRVFDTSGRPLQGAYVRYKGPTTGKRRTDAKGSMKVNVLAGRYLIDLPPCGPSVMPESPGEVDVVVVAGQTAAGAITEIPWSRRFFPTASVKVKDPAPWARGKTVRLAVRIEDKCDYQEAPGASVTAYRWKASSNFAFVSRPSRAGSDGFAIVSVRCTRTGDGSILIYDPVKGVKVDLLEAASQPDGTWCK